MMGAAGVIPGLVLGGPGIYRVTDEPLRAVTGVRMDVCAFLGVAPRGPARQPFFQQEWAPKPCLSGQRVQMSVPVAVESWDAYVNSYGGYEGPGLLPYAVSAFFQNGGARAYIVRIVHEYRLADGTADGAANSAGIAHACFKLPSTGDSALATTCGRTVRVRARNEGEWGNKLHATLSFNTRALAINPADFFTSRIRLPIGFDIVNGALLRLSLGNGIKTLRRVETLIEDWNPTEGSRELSAWFDSPTAVPASAAELVEASLAVDDGDNRSEVVERIGLSSNHPRWLGAVLVNESALIYPSDDPQASWLESDLMLEANLRPYSTCTFMGGADRYPDIVPDDFFDDDWVLGDECPGKGVHSLVDISDLSLVVAPDLYSPGSLAPIETIVDARTFAGAEFAQCVEPPRVPIQGPPPGDIIGLRLDPVEDLNIIAGLHRRLTDLADELESFVVLLDVPPGLSQRAILYWRSKFTSTYCAGYHPWVDMMPTGDNRNRPVAVNPAAIAAGIIAQREILFGVAYGPANVIANGAINVEDRVSPSRCGELHQHAVNVYLPERDGIRLTAARTLALNQTWRQLNVRRLVTMIRRALERQMQWSMFEPNTPQLRTNISHMLESFLRQLYCTNALSGATAAEAFFVKCDDELNPPALSEQGQLLAQVGIAPAEPLEFIVLNIVRSADCALTVET